MHRIAIIVFLLACPAWASRTERAQQSDDIFQMDRLLTIRIRMSAEQWRIMQPEKASRLAVNLAVVQRPTTQQALASAAADPFAPSEREPYGEGDRRPPGLVGNQYAYVKAAVTIDGQPYADVGVRYKGQWSFSLAGASPRKPLKLKFDQFVDDQTLHGIKTLNLSSNAVDPSFLRESLSYAFFREAGIPASRTCFALIYLTVDGLYDDEPLGLYTAIEEINKDFLYRHFGTTKGLVIRPERLRNLAYVGPRWEEYCRYNIQSDANPFMAGRFIDFTRLIHRGDDADFYGRIGTFVDREQFLRFIAANVLMVNLDGVLVNGHNFYVHIHPKTGQFSFIPWDLHHSFGPSNGQTLEEWVALTIDRPYRNTNRLVERLLMPGPMRDEYRHWLRVFSTGLFAPERMHERIEQLEQVVRRAEAEARAEGKAFPPPMQTNPPRLRPELKPFVTARVHSVMEQLAGRIEGDPVGGRPAPPKPTPAAAPAPAPKPAAAPTPAPAAPTTRPAAANPPARPAATPPARPAPPPKPRPLPLNPLAPQVVGMIDGNRDGRLSRDEAIDAAKHFFMARAILHRGRLDETWFALTFDYINAITDAFPPSFDDHAPIPDPLRPRPALHWAKVLLQQTDVTAAGHATLHDLLDTADRLFTAADANTDGHLTPQELGALLDQLVPRQ